MRKESKEKVNPLKSSTKMKTEEFFSFLVTLLLVDNN